MSKLYCIGELLIDFQSVGTASLKDTRQFVKNAGGAPANVCVQAIKLGQKGVFAKAIDAIKGKISGSKEKNSQKKEQ